MSTRFETKVDQESWRVKRAVQAPQVAVGARVSDTFFDKANAYLNDISFIRGVVYTSVPVSIISLVLLAAYKKDIHSSRNANDPTIFKYPMMFSLLLSFAAPFLINAYDSKLETALHAAPFGQGFPVQPAPQPIGPAPLASAQSQPVPAAQPQSAGQGAVVPVASGGVPGVGGVLPSP